MTHETDSTASVVVDKTYHWQPIDENTPRGQKLQLIHRPSGSERAIFGLSHHSACVCANTVLVLVPCYTKGGHMARHDEQTNVRIPAELKEWLKAQAAQARRSVTAELILRLEQSRAAQLSQGVRA